ncbi:hypothetical protein AB1388_06505 [Streptomyces hydrogenans]|uniref:hypothetical protein n=1 Tax=Streptomyces hydrogenans TaxID=1873719 RepID=UPI00278C3752|nr:hypothetical protein [Streptomyces hydrogenans]
MILPLTGRPTWKHMAGALVLATLIWTVWYGTQPVYPSCTFFGDSYEKAVEEGQCAPPESRFSTWMH